VPLPARPTEPDPLRDLYRALSGGGALPLEPDHPWYVPIHADDPAKDPILRLWQRLDLAESESVHLLTGFRGNGKSTELPRPRKLLHEETAALPVDFDRERTGLGVAAPARSWSDRPRRFADRGSDHRGLGAPPPVDQCRGGLRLDGYHRERRDPSPG